MKTRYGTRPPTSSGEISGLEDRWLNSPSRIQFAENKLLQLRTAINLGFDVPRTLVTNSFEEARRFVGAAGPKIAKPLRQALVVADDEERVIFTTRLDPDTPLVPEEIRACPLILQNEIKKRLDIRATVVGSTVFCAEIHSQTQEDTKVDWRRFSKVDLDQLPHTLPLELQEKCVALTRTLGLRFGAIDLILDVKGDYWFLEINPNGQWAWIEQRTAQPIASAIVSEMERIGDQHST